MFRKIPWVLSVLTLTFQTAYSASRGYLTTPAELSAIASKANSGKEPYRASALALYKVADTSFPSGWASSFNRDAWDSATTLLYAKAIAYHLKGDASYAAAVRANLIAVTGVDIVPGADDLGLVRHIPGIVAAADLIDDYAPFTAAEKFALKQWLASENVFRIVDEVSKDRANNWGFMGSGAAAYIADYLAGSSLTLTAHGGAQLSPQQAYEMANELQKTRMNAGNDVMDYGTCRGMPGIYPSGRIPHETGRGTTGCDGEYLLTTDSSWGYMIAAANGMVRHAELLLRRGDKSLYDYVTSTGRGSLLKSIRYVIDNPIKSYPWDAGQMEILEPAFRYYRLPAMASQLKHGTTSRVISVRGGMSGANGFLDFTTLTHGFAADENPGLPPVTPPPGSTVVVVPPPPSPTPTPDTTAPVASITSPANGATISGSVLISASASDNIGVSRVEFFVDGNLRGSDATAPYSVSIESSTLSAGSHSLMAKAYDAAGNVGSSSAVSVSVAAPLPPQILVFSATGDTYLQSNYPTANKGTAKFLVVDNDPKVDILVKFTVSGIGTRQVAGAKLRLYAKGSSSVSTYVYKTDVTSWSESSVNWSNSPAAGTLLGTMGARSTEKYVDVNLGSSVLSDGTYSFRIKATANDGETYDFASKEEGSAYAPKLELDVR